MAKVNLNTRIEELIKMAENSGVEQSTFFITTLDRYRVQISILKELEKKIKEEDSMVTKEYVKGRKNLYVNPAITEYNKTAVSANGTVQTLLKIITALSSNGLQGSANEDDDPFK